MSKPIKNPNNIINSVHNIYELKQHEAQHFNGGGFAYDAGFFLRAFIIGGGTGVGMCAEYAANYRPR